MSFVRDLNTVAGTGNPVQLQDLSYLWEAFAALAQTMDPDTIRIMSGFALSGSSIGGGVICFQNNAYILSANTATVGQYLYAQQTQIEQRVYEDGATRYMYTTYIVRASNSATSTGIGTLIGRATADNISMWKQAYIADNTLSGSKILTSSITSDKLGDGSVTGRSLQRELSPCTFSEFDFFTSSTSAPLRVNLHDLLRYDSTNSRWTVDDAYVDIELTANSTCIIDGSQANPEGFESMPAVVPIVVTKGYDDNYNLNCYATGYYGRTEGTISLPTNGRLCALFIKSTKSYIAVSITRYQDM